MRILLVFLAACAGPSAPPANPSGPPAPLESPPGGPDDLVVATVDGHPVWGSCVTAQAARGQTRDQALRQCVDFELMARAAAAKGLASDREVVDATRTALVSRLVAVAFEDALTKPSDMPEIWNQLAERGKARVSHAEYRGSAYVRAPVPAKSPPEVEAAAHALADEIAAAVAGERGLMASDLFAIARRVAGPRKIDVAEITPYLAEGLEDHYGAALFALPEIGLATKPVRTQWGWDVIAWTDVVPAHDATPDELIAKLLPDIKRTYFSIWVAKISKSLGIHVVLDPGSAARLEALP